MRHPFIFCVVFTIGGLLTKLTNELERQHMQTCTNCDKGSQCQNYFSESNTTELQQCSETCNSSATCDVGVYTSTQNLCQLYNCPLVQETCGKMTIRKSVSDDCLVYKLRTYPGYGGQVCGDVVSHNDISHLEYCLALCLDTTYCRGLNYYQYMATCILIQSCDGFVSLGDGWTFINRTCIGSYPSLSETQCNVSTTENTITELPSPSSKVTSKTSDETTVVKLLDATKDVNKSTIPSPTGSSANTTACSTPTMQYISGTTNVYSTTPAASMQSSVSRRFSFPTLQYITAIYTTQSATVSSSISEILSTPGLQYKQSTTSKFSITPFLFPTTSIPSIYSTSNTQYAVVTYIASSNNFLNDAGRVVALFTSAGLTALAAVGVCIYCLKVKWSGIIASFCRNPSTSPDEEP